MRKGGMNTIRIIKNIGALFFIFGIPAFGFSVHVSLGILFTSLIAMFLAKACQDIEKEKEEK